MTLTFVAGTNNQAYNYALEEGMENDLYRAVSSDVACQTAKAKALEVLMNLEVGEHAGNRKYLLNFWSGDFKLMVHFG